MATLSGNKIKDTYQSLIKLTDNGNLTTGAKRITDGFGNNSPLFLSTSQIGVGVTPTVQFHASGDGKFGGNLTVTGNLVVEGSLTTVGTDTLTVKDPLIVLANNNTSTDAVDIGFYGKYSPSSTTLFAGLFRDEGDDKFKLFKSLQVEPTTTVDTSGTGYTKAGLVIGSLEATTGSFTGNIELEAASGFAQVELGGPSGAIIDLKGPFSDDFDLRILSNTTSGQINAINGQLDITANTNINLQHQGSTKLQTTSTGITVTGTITGNVTGNLTGNVTGNVTGDVTGDLTGDVTGNLTGDVTGNVSGSSGSTTGNAATATKIASITNSDIVQLTSSQTLTNKTIDLDNNTVSNIEVDNLKSGVLDTDLSSVSGSDDTLASAKAIKTYVDGQISGEDLDIAGDSGTGSVDLDSQTFTIAGGTNVTTSVSNQTVTINATGAVDGSGTANDVVMWSDSDTLTDAPIAISGDNATFAGDVNVGGGDLRLDSTAKLFTNEDNMTISVEDNNNGTNANIIFKNAASTSLTLAKDLSATFAGNVDINGSQISVGTNNSRFAENNLRFNSAGGAFIDHTTLGQDFNFRTSVSSALDTTPLVLNGANAIFAGTIKQTGKTLTIEANDPEIILKDTDEGTDDKVFRIINVSEELRFTARTDNNDANADGGDVLKITRSGNSTFAGSITGTSAQFIDTSNPDGGSGTGEGGSVIIEGRRDGTANLLSLRSRDASAPTVALPNGQGGILRFQGFDGTDFAQMGGIQVVADGQAVANGDAPSKMNFYTVPDGTETLTVALALDKSQNATFAGDVEVLSSGAELIVNDTSNTPKLRLKQNGSTKAIIQTSSDDLLFQVPTERMRITSGGNVGIGTTSPNAKLHVDGGGKFEGNVTLTKSVGDTELLIEADTDNNNENDNPRLHLRQDGGAISAYFGLNGDVDNTFTGALANSPHIRATGGIQFAPSNTLALTLDTSQNATFAGAVGVGVAGGSNAKLEVVSTSGEVFRADASGGAFRIVADQTGVNTQGVLTHSGNLKFNGNTTISSNTTDGSDNAQLIIAGGGTDGDSRGASVHISGNESGNGGLLQLRAGSGSISQIRSYTSGTERMRIQSDGKIAIGTTAATANLEVGGANSTLRVGPRYASGGDRDFVDLIANGTDSKVLSNNERFHIENNSGHIIINPSSNVGIGTTSPSQKLHVVGNIYSVNSGTDGGQIRLANSGGGSNWYWAARTTGLNLGELGAADGRIFIANGGNVGIGTTSPNARLESNANVTFSTIDTFGQIVAKSTSGALGMMLNIGVDDGGDFCFLQSVNRGVGATPLVLQRYAGNVGIGISTIARGPLHVHEGSTGYSQVHLTNSSSGSTSNDGLTLFTNGNDAGIMQRENSYLLFGTNDTERMRIDSSGRVGIGNTSPGLKLDVTGDIRASADVIAFSDRKLKKNIKTLDGKKVFDMRGVSFTRIDTNKESSGVIAQEIQKIAPELVNETGDTLGVAYGNLTGYLIEAIKDLKQEIEELKKQIK